MYWKVQESKQSRQNPGGSSPARRLCCWDLWWPLGPRALLPIPEGLREQTVSTNWGVGTQTVVGPYNERALAIKENKYWHRRQHANLENVMLSERSQTWKAPCHIIWFHLYEMSRCKPRDRKISCCQRTWEGWDGGRWWLEVTANGQRVCGW